MDRVALYLAFLGCSLITGAVVMAGLSLGYYSVWTIVIGAVAGFQLALPTSYLISKLVKRQGQDWTPKTPPGDQPAFPRPKAPEV